VIVWHGRDTDAFDPARYPHAEMRGRLGWPEEARVVMFFGTIQPYKGVEDLVEAVSRLERDDVRLALVGAGSTPAARSAVDAARKTLGPRAMIYGVQPFERVPEFIAAADVVAVPQRDTHASRAQMPAKLFDAMAMARPVVATAVSDIPYALQDCGWVAEAGSPERLATSLAAALGDTAEAERRGERARRRCIKEFSWDAMERTLAEVLLEVGRPS
jgi:glycosyltransferase involved in cell wall biosynthesis